MSIKGFPVVEDINAQRELYSKQSHDPTISTGIRVFSWTAHKALSVIAFPTNILATKFAISGATFSACTLGTIKVALFALSFGQHPPTFSTGFLWFAERGLHSAQHIVINITELFSDVTAALDFGKECLVTLAKKLHMTVMLEQIFQYVSDTYQFITEQIESGFDIAQKQEARYDSRAQSLEVLEPLNTPTKNTRVGIFDTRRSLIDMATHSALSLLNIPLQATAAAVSLIATCFFGTVITAKTLLFAATSISVPLTTYAGYFAHHTVVALSNVTKDLFCDVTDVVIAINKAAVALKITPVVHAIFEVVAYIPIAIFS